VEPVDAAATLRKPVVIGGEGLKKFGRCRNWLESPTIHALIDQHILMLAITP
jgi:hypothetical protein